jgi:hypothetical protein
MLPWHKADKDIAQRRTLQELLAPQNIEFFDGKWRALGTKSNSEIAESISNVVGIPREVLQDPSSMFGYSIARRMSWAAKRQATRAEDIAYALLGLFKINMPMQYGEGTAAFVRLQKEIMKTTNDQSLFAWGYSSEAYEGAKVNRSYNKHYSEYGMFAAHPNDFANCKNLIFLDNYAPSTAFTEASGAVHMAMPLMTLRSDVESDDERDCIGFLPCTDLNDHRVMIGIPLKGWSSSSMFIRRGFLNDSFTLRVKPEFAAQTRVENICISNSAPSWLTKRRQQPVVGRQRTLSIHFDALDDMLRLISPESTGSDSKDITLHIPWAVRPEMLFRITSPELREVLQFRVYHDLIPVMNEEPTDHVVITEFYGGRTVRGDELRLAGSEAALLLPHAKIEVSATSHIVFNHVITDLRMRFRRFS